MTQKAQHIGTMLNIPGEGTVNTAKIMLIRDGYLLELQDQGGSAKSVTGNEPSAKFMKTHETAADFARKVIQADKQAGFVSVARPDSHVGCYVNLDFIGSVEDQRIQLNPQTKNYDGLVMTEFQKGEMEHWIQTTSEYVAMRQQAQPAPQKHGSFLSGFVKKLQSPESLRGTKAPEVKNSVEQPIAEQSTKEVVKPAVERQLPDISGIVGISQDYGGAGYGGDE